MSPKSSPPGLDCLHAPVGICTHIPDYQLFCDLTLRATYFGIPRDAPVLIVVASYVWLLSSLCLCVWKLGPFGKHLVPGSCA